MQQVTLFILKYCVYCRRALELLDDVLDEDETLGSVSLRIIDEGEERDLAGQFDYYYVPAFYIGDRKVHEGPVDQKKIRSILQASLQAD